MSILLLFCLPLIFGAYAFQLEEKHKHFFAFFIGIFTSSLFLLLISSFSLNKDASIGSLKDYLFQAFFTGTVIPIGIVVLAVLPLTGFSFPTVPSALFGLFTVKVYQQLFLSSAHVRIMPVVLLITVYAGTLFIFDALLHFCANITFYYSIACILCFCFSIGILMIGISGIGIRYFGGRELIYGSLIAVPAVVGTVLHIIVYRKGMSE